MPNKINSTSEEEASCPLFPGDGNLFSLILLSLISLHEGKLNGVLGG